MKRFRQRMSQNPVVVALACITLFAIVVLYMYAKVDAYGGDVNCLFVKCVRVIR